jgi:hypothetical protein
LAIGETRQQLNGGSGSNGGGFWWLSHNGEKSYRKHVAKMKRKSAERRKKATKIEKLAA